MGCIDVVSFVRTRTGLVTIFAGFHFSISGYAIMNYEVLPYNQLEQHTPYGSGIGLTIARDGMIGKHENRR